MSPRSRQSRGASARSRGGGQKRAKAVLLFGEHDHDRRAIKEIVEGLRQEFAASEPTPGDKRWREELNGDIQKRRQPLVLIKGVTPKELASRRASLHAQVKADRVRYDVQAVLVHEDCDAVEPAHEAVARRYEEAFREADFDVYPVLPAWEIEAWWLLWPDALGAYRQSWRAPVEHKGKHVGKIENAKQRLKRDVMPAGLKSAQRKKFPGYQESDSPGIAAFIRARGELSRPQGRSDSYEYFRASLVEDGSEAPST
ncbi:hypothetical protein [Haliangium sp.]|uniref:hypothetical protein n=1 Tax=Haliangium sp. TaxID=2663208 RepID=UPI003D0FC0D0